jgi:hypothetical protein
MRELLAGYDVRFKTKDALAAEKERALARMQEMEGDRDFHRHQTGSKLKDIGSRVRKGTKEMKRHAAATTQGFDAVRQEIGEHTGTVMAGLAAQTTSVSEGLDGVKASTRLQAALTTNAIDALRGDAREIAEGTKAAFTGVHEHLHSHDASIKSSIGGLEGTVKTHAGYIQSSMSTELKAADERFKALREMLVAQGTATTTGISKLQKSTDNITANTTALRDTFTQQARVGTTAFRRMEASNRTQSKSLNDNITVNTTATTTGFQEMKTSSEAQSKTICDGIRRLESSTKTQSDSLQDTLNSQGTIVTTGFKRLADNNSTGFRDMEASSQKRHKALTHTVASGFQNAEVHLKQIPALDQTIRDILAGKHSAIEQEYFNALQEKNRALDDLERLNTEKEELLERYEGLVDHLATNRSDAVAYENLGADLGAMIRDRRSADANFKKINNNVVGAITVLNALHKDTQENGKSVKDSETRIMAGLADMQENIAERIAAEILAKLPELPTAESVKQLEKRMSSGFTASRKGSKTILTTLKGMSTAGNAHIRAVELRAAQDDALNESHQNITESNIKLAETTRLQAQVVATGAQLISVSADHYRRMQDDHRRMQDDHRRMQDNLRTQATEIQQLKRQIEELRNNNARDTLPTPTALTPLARENDDVMPPVEEEEAHLELDPLVYDDLLRIKAWDGVNLMDFKDLSPEVQGSMLEWSKKIGPGWFDRVPGRKKSCAARGMSTNACLLPPDDMNVACGNCVGGKTFCVRRWSPTDSTATVFAMDSRDVQREGGVGDVSFWKNTKVGKTRPSKDMYTTKLQ